MQSITLIGMLAGTLTTLAFVPQVVKTWRTRSAEDISVGMLLLFSTGLALWLIYGIAIAALPIILANSVTLILKFAILLMKWRFAAAQRYQSAFEKHLGAHPVTVKSEA
jgi:MtN3 and saliva related transmembrane protein